MNTYLKHMSLGLLLTMAAAVSAPATAGEPSEAVRQMTVSYADLNLSRPEGVARLYQRLATAAAKVCEQADVGLLSNAMRQKACMDQAMARAVATVASPALSRFYAERTGKFISTETLAGRP